MIAKVLSQRKDSRHTFERDAAYVERFEAARAVFHSHHLDPAKDIPTQMQAVADRGTGRTRNPNYHFVLSWQRKIVSHQDAEDAIRYTIGKLGAVNCQWIAALHGDTDTPHVHVLVNRIQVNNFRAWKPEFDHTKLQRICQQLEPRDKPNRARTTKISPRAKDYEIYHGQLSLQHWGRQTFLPILERRVLSDPRPTWDDLHTTLARHGLVYHADGSIHDDTGRRRVRASASSISPRLRLDTLENRLGTYQPPAPHITPAVSGYASRRDRYELPTERVRRPDTWHYYERFTREMLAYYDHDKADADERKRKIRERTRAELEALDRDVQAALAESAALDHDREFRRLIKAVCRRAKATKRAEIMERQKHDLHVISLERPQHYIFREWLKALSTAGDPAATALIRSMRRGEPITTTHLPPTLDPRDVAYAERAAATAYTWSTLGDEALAAKLAAVKSSDLPTYAKYLSTTTQAVHDAATPEQRDDAGRMRDLIVAALPRHIAADPTGIAVANAAAYVAVAATLAADGKIPEHTAAALFAPLAANGLAYADLHPDAELVARRAKYLEEAHERVHGVTTRPTEPPTPPWQQDNTTTFTEDEIDDLGLDAGKFTAGDRDTTPPPRSDAREEDYRRQYEASLKLYTELGAGAARQLSQTDITKRRNLAAAVAIDQERAETPEKFWRAHSKLAAQALILSVTNNRRARLEADVLTTLTGTVPPPTFNEYLRRLGTPEALEVANSLPPEPAQHRPRFLDTKYHLLTSLTATETDAGMVYHLAAKKKTLFRDHNDPTTFLDDGDSIRIKSTRDDALTTAALLFAAERFGGTIKLHGTKAFKERMLVRAVELGITVTNPEYQALQTRLRDEIDRKRADDRAPTPSATATKLSKAFAETLALPLDHPERIPQADAITLEAVKHTIKTSDRKHRDITIANGDENGTLADLLIFARNAYAVIDLDDGTRVVARLPAGPTQHAHANTTNARVQLARSNTDPTLAAMSLAPEREQEHAHDREAETARTR